ncbi:myoblast growth factor receptor egl-15-like [Dysidea avara]|uniref:myoblast growth factor receptor egl-15-like n=1 Tax=Dysidea avara TaxID=196820 RepID=UPI0033231740
MRVLVVVIVLQLISVITGSEDLAEDQRREICRDLGFVATNDFITVKFQGVTQNELKIRIGCSDRPDIWCRVVFSGNCSCVQHNTSKESPPGFPGMISFDNKTINIKINKSIFPSYSGSFVACAVDKSIYKVLHIASTHTTVNNDDDEDAKVRQAAVNTIIVCLLSILICVGPCFVLTFIGKYRQEQLRQKIIEEEKECTTTNVLGPPTKVYREQSRQAFERNFSETTLILPKNSTSSVGSIYSLGGEHCFKLELLAHGRTSDYWRGVYTGPLPCGNDKNSVCIKMSIATGQEKMLLTEAEILKQLPPHNHVINFLLSMSSKAEGPVMIYELAWYRDLYSFLCAKRKAIVTEIKDQWSLLGSNIGGSSAYGTPNRPSLLIDIPELLETYSLSAPFKSPLLQRLSDLDYFVFAHQIASGMEYLSSRNIVHKQLTCESVLIFENFVLKLTNFDVRDSSSTDQPEKHSTTTRAPAIERAQVIARTISGRPSVKWQAPEVMKSETYSSESDVWSYGMTLWEITNYGDTPFDDVVLRLLLRAIEEENYPLKAENCNADLYSLMKSCWKRKGHRPSFTNLLNSIHKHLMQQQTEKTGTIRLDDSANPSFVNPSFLESDV